jgi:uncharacterized protein YbbC (DUF1343 family)
VADRTYQVIIAVLVLLLSAGSCVAADAPPAVLDRSSRISEVVEQEIASGRLPGAVITIGRHDRVAYRRAFGAAAVIPRPMRMRTNAIFDLASLTKVFTATAVMQLVEDGRLALDRPVAAYWPEFASSGKDTITVKELLTHTSGLPPDIDLAGLRSKASLVERIVTEKLVNPPGTQFHYSDIGFVVLGELIQRVSGEPLDVYVNRHIFKPLGMRDTGFRPAAAKQRRIVPTDMENGLLRWGVVQDPIAHLMDGVAGHAGVFSTADDLTKFSEMLLGQGSRDGIRVLRPESVERMTTAIALPGGIRRNLGWDMSSPYSAGIDTFFGPSSYGHTGYTGTLLWIDPTDGEFLIILTSRLHPDARGDARPLRQAVARLVGSASNMTVLPGIDVLAAENFAPLAGKRVALLTNQATRDRAGHRTIDQLAQAPGVHLVKLFTPEHGLSAEQEGEVDSGRDASTGLPVVSLYGATSRPTDEMLDGLDAIVIDLQDAGVRFYTYPTTVAYVMEEAARRKVEVFVLDRPNPVNASIVQGPVLDPALRSFTGYFPMPIRHGMTLGELAAMFNAELGIGAQLSIIPMQNYGRSMWYDYTGLAWRSPSPNLKSIDAATLYAGVGLVEGANVSVGRGTDSPFGLIGAPWLDAGLLTRYLRKRTIAGIRFEPARFTPAIDRYAGQICNGTRIVLTDRARFDAAALGLELISALHQLYPKRFDINATRQLVGSESVFNALKVGSDPREMPALWKAELDSFGTVRAKYLLYSY